MEGEPAETVPGPDARRPRSVKSPKWLSASTKQFERLAENLSAELKSASESAARVDLSETVNVRHVDRAYHGLLDSGFCRPRGWRRVEYWAAAGGLLIGSAWNIPDIVDVFGWSETATRVTALTTMIVMVLIGAGLFFFSWLLSSRRI